MSKQLRRFGPAGLVFAAVFVAALGFLTVASRPASTATANFSEVVGGVQAIVLPLQGTITTTNTYHSFRIPFAAEVLGVSVHSLASAGATLEVTEAGTAITTTALAITTGGTVYEAILKDTSLADEALVGIKYNANGATLTNPTVCLTLRRTN